MDTVKAGRHPWRRTTGWAGGEWHQLCKERPAAQLFRVSEAIRGRARYWYLVTATSGTVYRTYAAALDALDAS